MPEDNNETTIDPGIAQTMEKIESAEPIQRTPEEVAEIIRRIENGLSTPQREALDVVHKATQKMTASLRSTRSRQEAQFETLGSLAGVRTTQFTEAVSEERQG